MDPAGSTGGTSRRLHLVRHGLPAIDTTRPAHEWGLDQAGYPAIDALRDSGRLPGDADWFSSPEPKALATARRLTDSDVTIVRDLREHERRATEWIDDFTGTVQRAFAHPDESAFPGWEPLANTRDRLVPAVRRILAEHPDGEIVLVGHGTAWTVLASELTGTPPDLDAWAALRMPGLWTVQLP